MLANLLEGRRIRRAMANAEDYAEWYEAARSLDALEDMDEWMQEEESGWYDAGAVRGIIAELINLRETGSIESLIECLEQALYRHHHELVTPKLYAETYCGENKQLPRSFLDQAARTLRHLAEMESEAYPAARRLELFRKAARTFGRSALMLSGGATLGIYHLGVVKALFDLGLLPRVISGSSMGAIVAALICTRTEAELRHFFAHPEEIQRTALKLKAFRSILREKSFFDADELHAHIRANLPSDYTFAEAWERTGWVLNISVAPTRKRQKPKLLHHLSTPELLVSHSAAVSCAMPFLYQPGRLFARDKEGKEVEYLATERWVDGSLGGDLPMARVSRMHNVNHYIVSQTNPYVYIFQSKSETPALPYMGLEVLGSLIHSQACSLLDTARKYVRNERLRPVVEQLHALTAQPYVGDINFHPRINPTLLSKYVANPSLGDVKRFMLEGERITWPKMAMVRDHTLISRTFESCIAHLRERVAAEEVAVGDESVPLRD